jgi:argininosuccinate lyase
VIERRVTELAGDAGARLHTGRSRNDQVATAFRLFCKDAVATVAEHVVELQAVLLEQAAEAGRPTCPATPICSRRSRCCCAHHLLAHFWSFSRDLDRLVDAARRLDVSPLGAGALAGSSLPLDPAATARAPRVRRLVRNSLDAVSDRDFAAEILFDFGDDRACTSAHRRGDRDLVDRGVRLRAAVRRLLDRLVDAAAEEEPRHRRTGAGQGRPGDRQPHRPVGHLKALPLAYNRDLQEDKEPLFDSVDQVRRGLGAVAGMLATIEFRTDRMQASADSPYAAATDLAEYLVRSGVPFRDAHAVVGSVVRRSIDNGVPLADLVAAEPLLGDAAVGLLGSGVSVTQRTTPGGAGPDPVAEQLQSARLQCDSDRSTAERLRSTVSVSVLS